MTVKEAEEIVEFVEDENGLPQLDSLIQKPNYDEAKGFLACHEKMKPLVEAAILHSETWKGVVDETRHSGNCRICRTLSTYRRDVLGLEGE